MFEYSLVERISNFLRICRIFLPVLLDKMETLFVYLNVQLQISLCAGNLQMLLETELLKKNQIKSN